MPMGNNMPVGTLKELLSGSDFVTLHVPASKETNNMISRWELMHMRKGRCIEPLPVNFSFLKTMYSGLHLKLLKEQALKVWCSGLPDGNGAVHTWRLENITSNITQIMIRGQKLCLQAELNSLAMWSLL